jgi:uncharacterized protein YoxC
MTSWIACAGAWLALQASTFPDTIYTKQIAAAPTLFDRVAGVAGGLVSITLVVLAAALVPAAWNFRKSYKRINQLLERVYGDVTPIMRHASVIADNVDYITTSIRADVQRVNQTISQANQRLSEAVTLTERRLREFHALLDVVQQEAEGAFVSTASTVRGLRAGAAAFREEDDLEGDDLEGDDLVAPGGDAVEPDDALNDDMYDAYEERTDGHDGRASSANRRAGPRIRPRDGERA